MVAVEWYVLGRKCNESLQLSADTEKKVGPLYSLTEEARWLLH